MDEFIFKQNSLILRKIIKEFRVTPIVKITLTHGINIIESISLPDSSYGEYIIYEGDIPKYYFTSFYENGDSKKILAPNLIAKYSDIQVYLIDILHSIGYRNAKVHNSCFQFKKEHDSYMKKFEMTEIVDLEF